MIKNEYLNTLSDVLNFRDNDLAELLPDDSDSSTFRNAVDVLLPSGLRTDAYEQAAQHVANTISENTLLQNAQCTQEQTFCYQFFIDTLGRKLYRDQISQESIASYEGLFELARQQGDGFIQGARLVLQAMLQAPQFLYRLDTEASRQNGELLPPAVLASRLSYFLWQSAPDDDLLRKINNGGFNAQNIEATVDEMLLDERAKRMLATFVDEWLQLYLLDTRQFDTAAQPDYTPDRVKAMKAETLGYFERLVFDQAAPFMTAYTQQNSVIDNSLAKIYGLNSGGLVDWSGERNRIGFLTQASLLATHAKSDRDSVVRRGLFVLDRLQCQPVPALPAALQQSINEAFEKIEESLPQRDRLQLHNANQSCADCHAQFDGLGYAFEPFSAFGHFRVQDQFGNAIEKDGIARVDMLDIPFTDVTEFAELMAESEWAKRCVVTQNLRFAFGRDVTAADDAIIEVLLNNFEVNNQNLLALIKDIALAEPFLKAVAN